MPSLLWCSVLLSLLALPIWANGQSQEILVPVTGKEARLAISANDHFVSNERYFAKRYRIVRVNTDLLLNSVDKLTLSLFGNVVIPVVRSNIELSNGGVNFVWHGQYAYNEFTFESFAAENPQLTTDKARGMYNSFVTFQIFGSKFIYEYDPAKAEGLAGLRRDPKSGRLIDEQERLADKLSRGTEVYDLRFDISPLLLPTQNASKRRAPFSDEYRLRSLPWDRRYSILYEVDRDKNVPALEHGEVPTPSEAEKIQQYREFIESMGEDPRAKNANQGVNP